MDSDTLWKQGRMLGQDKARLWKHNEVDAGGGKGRNLGGQGAGGSVESRALRHER